MGFRGDDAPPAALSDEVVGGKVEVRMIPAAELSRHKDREADNDRDAKRQKAEDGASISGTSGGCA